ncbi:hypothetical protein H0H81_002091 [Sphagnurus paluster]|uniref:Uncharacterized protein n=1 Tax=Sphagnurus paluster TaxID=117069 RepID=A0A9P7FT09_9AGAR|nr:hypothetical protein H0H81_002091 [Sphagnurus paluster]
MSGTHDLLVAERAAAEAAKRKAEQGMFDSNQTQGQQPSMDMGGTPMTDDTMTAASNLGGNMPGMGMAAQEKSMGKKPMRKNEGQMGSGMGGL